MLGRSKVSHLLGSDEALQASKLYKLRPTTCVTSGRSQYCDVYLPTAEEWINGVYRTRFDIYEWRSNEQD